MQGKFRLGLDGADATARQIGELRRQIRELSTSLGKSVVQSYGWITDGFQNAVGEGSGSGDDHSPAGKTREGRVLVPSYGGTGTGNAFVRLLTTGVFRTAWLNENGEVGVLPSSRRVIGEVSDADVFIDVQDLRRVKWQVFLMGDDLNQHLDGATPMVGMVADDLDAAGLGFFCEYDEEGNVVGVNYPMLGVAALRLAQQAMDEVDELKAQVSGLAAKVDGLSVDAGKISGVDTTDSIVEE